ncbi:12860_t:CDS:10 [Funneliformis geosporum]|nr:12860_t:CDS:10 [Funneliformis geosporum]
MCNKEIKLDKAYRVHNLDIHSKNTWCKFTVQRQPTLNCFWKLNKEEQRTIETPCINVACSGLTDKKYHNYILLNPLQHGGDRRVDTVDVLEKDQRVLLKRTLLAYYQWKLDKEVVTIFSTKCLNFTTNRSSICDNCFEFTTNAQLNDAIKTKRHTDATAKYIPNSYFQTEFVKLLKNQNLKKLYCASASSDEAKIWLELAKLERKEAFTTNKTFKELSILNQASIIVNQVLHFRSKDQDILTNLEIFLENIVHFAKVADELQWKGLIILMTDCMKLQSKVVYSQEFGSIIGSILPADQTKCETYDDIHKTMKNIKEQEAVATQVRGFLLKIPMSKILPVMIAALPAKGDETAKEISDQLLKIIDMTASYGINLFSLGADSANTEMKAQQIDDGAAFRVFHSRLLGMCQDNGVIDPGKLGLFVYLFVLGELFDAYLNYEISHKTRIIMVMRAYFFLNFWKSYIEKASKKLQKSVLLIISYHDYYEDYLLLPWEHETEALEYVFRLTHFGMKKEKVSATGYIFDLDSNDTSVELLELLRQWSTQDEIYGAMEVEYVDDSTTNINVNNNSSENEQLVDIANEIAQNNTRATLSSRVAEPEELLFYDDELDVLKALNIRESHNAFSRADRLCGI